MKLSMNGTPSPFYLYYRMGGQLVSAHYTYRSLGFSCSNLQTRLQSVILSTFVVQWNPLIQTLWAP